MKGQLRLDILVTAWIASATVGSAADHRIRVLRQIKGPDHTVTIIAFDYTMGTASRIVRNEQTGAVLSEQRLPGRPQSSREEFEEAIEIISRDGKLASLLSARAIAEGGFIVDGPHDHASRHRYIQIRLLTPDRANLLRVVVVDLTIGAVASSSTWFD